MGETKTELIERLFVQQRSSLLAFFRKRVRATDSAELAQEVYLRMLRISDTDVIRNPEAYLYTVASNLAREHHVLEKRYVTRSDMDELPADGLIADLPSAGSEIDTELRTTRLREVLAQLSPKCQAVVALQYWHGLSYAEIAAQTGISPRMVKKYLQQALIHCRRRMGRLR
jgi:RNA polymerase sigma factor (sigma-70 family)